MNPALAVAPEVVGIKPRELCVLAAKELGDKETALVALGAISNMYCLYALEHPEIRRAQLHGFVCEEIAERDAVLGEIRKAVPGIGMERARMTLNALQGALKAIFEAKGCRYLRLVGFGVFEAVCTETAEYSLNLELPLAGAGRAAIG
ncbi:MAG: hypothetical protein ACKV2U_05635 [Bryobacteraceae bacterium]